MTRTASARTTTRRTLGPIAVGLVVVIAAIIATLAYQSASSAPPFSDVLRGDHGGTPTEADGALPDGVTVFDDQFPGVANLDPDLLKALREAATDTTDSCCRRRRSVSATSASVRVIVGPSWPGRSGWSRSTR